MAGRSVATLSCRTTSTFSHTTARSNARFPRLERVARRASQTKQFIAKWTTQRDSFAILPERLR